MARPRPLLPPEPFPKTGDLDRLTQRRCRSLQTVTDLGELSRREVDAFLLDLGALLLAVSAQLLAISTLAKRRELALHLRHGTSEVR